MLVVGDAMLDRYWYGGVERISPEAPVPVVAVNHVEERPGGATNVASNATALGASCTLMAVTGDNDGEQSRDFVSVEDVVAVNFWFLDNPDAKGIFNLGTGRAQPFNDIATATVNALRQSEGKEDLTLDEMIKDKIIEYIEFPDALKGKYQSFTCADIGALRKIGYDKEFLTVEQGVGRYIKSLLKKSTA